MEAVLQLDGLEVDCILGDLPEERIQPRRIWVDVRIVASSPAADTDNLSDAIDYVELAGRIRARLVEAKCRLLERAARVALDAVLEDSRVGRATVGVAKKASIPGLASARVEMTGGAI